MKRVMIVGGPGSGKSTLARRLGARTGLPVHHMDHIHWQSGWVERPKPEKISMARQVEDQAAWIFEGGLSATYDHRASRADTLIWLDLPVGLRLWRVLKRSLRDWGRQRPDLPEGCRERIDAETWHFLRFIWRSRRSSREKIVQVIDAHPGLALHHLCSPRAVQAFEAGQ